MKLKKIISTIVAIAMLSSMLVFAAPVEGFEVVAENDRLVMYYNKATAEIAVSDKAYDNYTWYSNNQLRENDTFAIGTFKMDLSSQLLIRVLNTDKRVENSKNSFTASVKKNAFKSQPIKNGIKITYTFKDEKISVPLEITLGKDNIEARVPLKEVKEEEKNRLLNVSILPFMGSGSTEDTGYMFVPDGSGAIINFNNGKVKADDYNRPVYGTDPVYTQDMLVVETQDIKLPVFGIKNGNNAFLAVIEEGAETANILASISGNKTSFNSVYADFSIRYAETFNVSNRTVKIYEGNGLNPPLMDELKIKYYLLGGPDANYSGMARRYKQYLVEDKKATVVKNPTNDMLIDVLAATQKKTNFLGIPYVGVTPVTTYNQTIEMLSDLKKSGISEMSLSLTGYSKDDINRQIQKAVQPLGKLGGSRGFKKMMNYLGDNKILFFPTSNSTRIYKSGNGVSKIYNGINNIVGTSPVQYSFKLSTYYKNTSKLSWKNLMPTKVPKIAEKFVNSLVKKKISGVAYLDLVNNTYADFKGKGVSRTKSASMFADTLKYSKDKLDHVMGVKANGFALPYLTHVAQVPIWDSGFDVEDYSVPFYQIALSGLKQYYVPAINHEASVTDTFLRAIETGSKLSYTFTYGDSVELITTEYDNLYSPKYKDWIGTASEQYRATVPIFEATKNSSIYLHEMLQSGVYKTTYENGYYVIVNYNEQPVEINGQTISPKGYISAVGGEGR